MTQLTHDEWRALTYIQHYTDKWQVAPSSSHIRGACCWSKSEVRHILNELDEKGVVVGKMTQGSGVLRWRTVPGVVVGVVP
jgi:hypothetical protein